MARLKRKAAKQDPYDSDEIKLESRTALDDISVTQTQNKRQRTAQCVLIPKEETARAIARLDAPVTLSRTPSEGLDEDTELKLGRGSDTAADVPSESAESDSPPSRRRPRRATQRTSYVQQVLDSDDESGDEVAVKKPAPARKRGKQAKPVTASSDYGEDSASPPESDEDVPSDASEGSGSAMSVDEPSDVEEVVPVAKASKAKTATSRQNPKIESDKQADVPTKKRANVKSKNMLGLLPNSVGLRTELPPLYRVEDIFADLTKRGLSLGFDKAVEFISGRPLRLATMCSGTESPLLALQMIQDSLKFLSGQTFEIDHLFSAEIVPYKQAYIERNFNPPIIFRDITELVDVVDDETPLATTAYGAKVPVPKEIDIVVAGTSCVDFSNLNKHKKSMSDEGESGGTWKAVLAFCKAFQPAMVVLENVRGAPWDDMLRDYADVGYETAGAYVDSKNFYVPQTRQRGYMVCFNKERLKAAGMGPVGDKWKKAIEGLQRPASSPVSSYLLSGLSTDQIETEEPRREVEWTKCEVTQMQYRLKQRLGVARPFTHWSESGSMLPPDHGSRAYHRVQVERVLDTMDAAALRKAREGKASEEKAREEKGRKGKGREGKAPEGYDVRFKTRIWDLSQNIYMNEDTARFGLVGCLTPTGIQFVSDAWREMTAEECLKLQGIPLSKISFTVETPAEVRDLAGNAMTATVVGSAILSSLIAGGKMFSVSPAHDQGSQGQAALDATKTTTVELVPARTQSVTTISKDVKADVKSLLALATQAQRRCYCEGGHGSTQRAIQQCVDCSHTTCVACGGNPEHRYRPVQNVQGRTSMPAFEESLRSVLPLRLELGSPTIRNLRSFASSAAAGFSDLCDAVEGNLATVFSLSHVRRTYCLHAVYEAPKSRIELCLTDSEAEWLVYVDTPEDVPADALLRKTLQQPIARVACDTTSFFGTALEWRVPTASSTQVSISGSGEKMPTWWARMQMPEFKDHWQFQLLEIEASDDEVAGTYQYLPKCGTACESLYKRIRPVEPQPMLLFLDPTRIGPANEDRFVFTRNAARLEYDEVRQVVAFLDATWRPWDHEQKAKTTLIKESRWMPDPDGGRVASLETSVTLSRPLDITAEVEHKSCTDAITIMTADVDLSSAMECVTLEASGLARVALENERFFAKAAWAFEAMRRELPTNQWIPIEAGSASVSCTDCAPSKPSLRWMLNDDGQSIAPYEDPRSAAIYERTMKARQCPIVVEANSTSLSLGINLISLAHRARARLPENAQDVTFQFMLATSSSEGEASKPFRLLSTQAPKDDTIPAKLLSVDLFPKQRAALAWMKQQEAGQEILLEEAEESTLPCLGWRAEMRAQIRQNVKGGICADHPGFGKTITSLALIESEWLDLGAKGIVEGLQPAAESKAPGFRVSAATLIVCGQPLMQQWYEEARDKWLSSGKIHMISTAAAWAKLTIKELESAKMIIVNRSLLVSDAYAERLAAYAAVPGPTTDKGRAYTQWHDYATQQLPEHLALMERSGKKELLKHLQEKYGQNLDSEQFRRHVPSKRLRGQAVQDAKVKKSAGAKEKAAKPPSASLDVQLVAGPLLEMFYFNRVIVDEFHECSPKDLAAVAALKADKRWGLSGTPALSDCFDVAQNAKVLGITLRPGSIARGTMLISNARAMRREMTSFEQFELMKAAPSSERQARIREIAQGFLDAFVRQNVMDFDELSVQQHVVPESLDLAHHATYHELSQHLTSSEMRIKKSSRGKTTDRELQISEAVANSSTAEEALSKSAAFPRGASTGADSHHRSTLDRWIEKREQEVSGLVDELSSTLQKAFKNEVEAYADLKHARLHSHEMGDESTTVLIRDLCDDIDGGKGIVGRHGDAHLHTDGSGAKTKKKEEKREVVSQAQKLMNRLLVSRRSLRFVTNVKQMQAIALKGKERFSSQCESSACKSKHEGPDHVALSVGCGHAICQACYVRNEEMNNPQCPVDGCRASMNSHQMLWDHHIGDLRSTDFSDHGAKISAAVRITEDIRRKGDQAVLFVQYENQLEEMEAALDAHGIPATVVKEKKHAGTQVKQFCASKKHTVIVLNASDETAAGLNLQNANHVIFLSPLLRDTQYAYDSTMAQAIGRVRRHGQKKRIFVYRVVALHTIDVDILEHRERRMFALTEQGERGIEAPEGARVVEVEGEPKERVQLVREGGKFSLRPLSWLVGGGGGGVDGADEGLKVRGRSRVEGWEDFSSLVKFSRTFTEGDG